MADVTTLTMPAEARETLRRAALTQAASTLREAADTLDLAADDPTRLTLSDAATAAKIVREDLEAVEALGFEEQS